MKDESVDKIFRWLIFSFIAAGLFGVLLSTCDAEASVEYSVVDISELKQSDSGRHVAVHGWSRDVKVLPTRSGYFTSQMTIDGLLVIMAGPFNEDVIGEHVLVLGVYRDYCKGGGLYANQPCIIIDRIMGPN